MNGVDYIYYNDFGISFYWKRCPGKDFKKVQLVFRDTGMSLTTKELLSFSKNIEDALKGSMLCEDCKKNLHCKALLLETPIPQVSFAMNYSELMDISDLIKTTLFELGLNKMLERESIRKK